MQFTASEEYVGLVDEARALLSHAAPRVGLEDVHLRAMRGLVTALKKKYGASGFAKLPRQRGRHIPAAVRRSVLERDGNQCAYVDEGGQRCVETHRLEPHHLKAFALGGEHTTENVTLRCRAHNALAAEEDFGREVMDAKRDGSRHEPP